MAFTKDDERLLLDFAETMESEAREVDPDFRGDVYDALVESYRRRASDARDLAYRIRRFIAGDAEYRSWPENVAVAAQRMAEADTALRWVSRS